MFWIIVGSLLASFIVTGMLAQMFPDGRFPLSTIGLVILMSAVGAYAGHRFLSDASLITGGLVGAALTSGVLLFVFHRTGVLAQEPWPTEGSPPESGEE